jgi:hypothetical protein
MFDRFPHGHIEQNAIVIVRTQVRGVAFRRLQPPYESRTSVSQGIYFIEPRHEPCHDRILQRCFHSTDIDLSNP